MKFDRDKWKQWLFIFLNPLVNQRNNGGRNLLITFVYLQAVPPLALGTLFYQSMVFGCKVFSSQCQGHIFSLKPKVSLKYVATLINISDCRC